MKKLWINLIDKHLAVVLFLFWFVPTIGLFVLAGMVHDAFAILAFFWMCFSGNCVLCGCSESERQKHRVIKKDGE